MCVVNETNNAVVQCLSSIDVAFAFSSSPRVRLRDSDATPACVGRLNGQKTHEHLFLCALSPVLYCCPRTSPFCC